MENILEELWYGNICPNADYYKGSPETKALLSRISDYHSDLTSTLTDKQIEVLEKFNECYNEISDIYERKIFEYAFKLGARIAIEIMSFDA